MSNTPELDKMRAVSEQSQIIGEFLDSMPYVLTEWKNVEGFRDPMLVPASKSIVQILAEHFGIDMNKVEQERRMLLEEIRDIRKETLS